MNNICAKEGCSDPSYAGNALVLQSPIGSVVVYFCHKHIAEIIRVNMANYNASVDQGIERNKQKEQQS